MKKNKQKKMIVKLGIAIAAHYLIHKLKEARNEIDLLKAENEKIKGNEAKNT